MPGGRIYHLVDEATWAAERGREALACDQFERHGFVHCCFREQIAEIATWWFDAGLELVALELDPGRLQTELRYERSPSRWYPHLYGPIDAAAVLADHRLDRDTDGASTLPASLLADGPPSFRLHVAGAAGPLTWRDGRLTGDGDLLARLDAAVAEGRPIELLGGVVVPAGTATPYEAYATVETVCGEIAGYDGDGFFS